LIGVGVWQWDHNPFVGTQELQGLKIMMLLLDNWDIKDSNNRIVRFHDGQSGEAEVRYVVSDLGATLGKTGGAISRSRNNPADFSKAKLVSAVKGNRVEFHYSGKQQSLFRDLTVDQAKWIGQLLSRLSDAQIADAFRAANYSAEEIQMLTGAVRARINDLNALAQTQQAGSGRAQ
jgi:hypothetical protein